MEKTYGGRFLPRGATAATREQWIASVMQNDSHNSEDLEFQKRIQEVNSGLLGILSLRCRCLKILMYLELIYLVGHTLLLLQL